METLEYLLKRKYNEIAKEKVYQVEQDFLDLPQKQIEEIIDFCEFDVYQENNKYKLFDRQCANLGNIEEEEFDSMNEILLRIEHYIDEYYFGDLDESLKNIKKIIKKMEEK